MVKCNECRHLLPDEGSEALRKEYMNYLAEEQAKKSPDKDKVKKYQTEIDHHHGYRCHTFAVGGTLLSSYFPKGDVPDLSSKDWPDHPCEYYESL